MAGDLKITIIDMKTFDTLGLSIRKTVIEIPGDGGFVQLEAYLLEAEIGSQALDAIIFKKGSK